LLAHLQAPHACGTQALAHLVRHRVGAGVERMATRRPNWSASVKRAVGREQS
jgi:hypothetical protein